MRLPHQSYWLLVAIAVLMVLGHICALPFHAHAGAMTTHQEHRSHHGDESPGEDAAHAASCEAAKSASAGIDGVILVPLGTVVVVGLAPTRRATEADALLVVGSPPLFLLHASLLI